MSTFLESPSFTIDRARRTKRGAIQWDDSSGLSVEDEWTVVRSTEDPPVGFAIRVRGQGAISRNVAGSFPARNSPHPDYGAHFVARSIRWDRDAADSRVWRASVLYKYSRQTLSSHSGSDDKTGVLGVEFYGNSVTSPVNLANSAGELITPAPAREVASPCIRIQLRSHTRPASMMAYLGAVNNSSVTICGITFPPYTARCNWTVSSVEEQEDDGEGGSTVVSGLYDYSIDIQGNFTPAPEGGKFADGTLFSAKFGKAATGDGMPLLSGWMQLVADAGYCYRAGDALVRFKVAASEDLSVQQDSHRICLDLLRVRLGCLVSF